MGRLILHMGGHKTGSSAVQLWLTQNAEALRGAGILFPKQFVSKTGNASSLARALVLTPGRKGDIPVQPRADFLSFCKEHSDLDVFVSAERFESELLPRVRTAREGGDGEPAAPAPTEAMLSGISERLEHIRSFAQEAGFSGVTLVYLIRNLADRTSSGFAQKIKAMTRDAFEEQSFDPRTAPYRDHAAYNRLMEELGFTVAMDVLDPAAVSVVDQVMRLAGLSERVNAVADVATPRANESIGQLGVLAGMHLARVLAHGPQDRLAKRRHALSAVLRQCCAGVKDAPFNGFLPEEAAMVARTQGALNEALGPWMTPDRIAMVAQPRRNSPRSPLSIEDLDEDQLQTVRGILHDVADILCSGEYAAYGYSRDDIMAIGALPPGPKTSKRAARQREGRKTEGKAVAAGIALDGVENPARQQRKLARRASRQAGQRQTRGKAASRRPSSSHDT